MTGTRLFLCTDLDRTLLPNGPQSESSRARSLFANLVTRAEVILAYVTGRNVSLVDRAIANFVLPKPDFAITDVGTKIHARHQGEWQLWSDWEEEIETDWAGYDRETISALFRDLSDLRRQEPAKQNTHKLSYYLPIKVNRATLHETMTRRLVAKGIRASLIWSVDEPAGIGLLDVLPERATKLHAVEFLRRYLGVPVEQTLFAGDSGNDLSLMASSIPSVLVGNATTEVQEAARRMAQTAGQEHALYLARGGYLGMNGNYSAGILEGISHFHPELAGLIESASGS